LGRSKITSVIVVGSIGDLVSNLAYRLFICQTLYWKFTEEITEECIATFVALCLE
jgi:hypothetical protein